MKIIAGAILLAASLWGQAKEGHVTLLGKDVAYLYSDPSAESARPLLVLLPDQGAKGAFERWSSATNALKWRLLVPSFGEDLPPWSDFAAKALDLMVADSASRAPLDRTSIYLAGEGSGGSEVFFQLSRVPDLWAAALAVNGSPQFAIESNRFFTANAAATPVLWIVPEKEQPALEPLRARLTDAGCHVELRSATGATTSQAFAWLAGHHRELAPQKIDCETGNLAFARCGWIEIARLDPAQRNEAAPSTRIAPGSGAYLDLGGFGFDAAAPGPGLAVTWLPDGYNGKLQIGDRIVSVGGKEIGRASDYVQLMSGVKEEKPVAVMVVRGKERMRIETALRLPRRDEIFTARVQGEFLPAEHEIQIISRGISELQVSVPEQFAPARITWNGLEAAKAEKPGAWSLRFEKDTVSASPAPSR
jgi:hypothetical protein